MPYSEAQKRATRKYMEKAYDRLELQLKKGMKDVYRAQAAAHGLSLNAYIISLLDRDASTSHNQIGERNGILSESSD